MQINKSIRIKITGHCNRKCFFCHEEGNMTDIENIEFSEELKNIINKLEHDFSIERIALTGGEPLLYPNLKGFIRSLTTETNIKNVSITTNGTIGLPSEIWKEMNQDGLFKVNISIPEILRESRDNQIDQSFFYNQVNLIQLLNLLGIQVDINVVVCNDEYTLDDVIKGLHRLKKDKGLIFDIVLLPNLKDYNNSIKAINIFRNKYELVKLKTSNVAGTSNSIETYSSNVFGEIFIKTTKLTGKPFWLPSMCSKCEMQSICQEGFYGLRLEKRNGKICVRLCIHKETNEVVMPFDTFVGSKLYKEVLKSFAV